MKEIAKGRSADIYFWKSNDVLKLYRKGVKESAIENERIISRYLRDVGLPVPEVKDVIDVNGRKGLVLEYVNGPTMQEKIKRAPWNCWRLAGMLADLHTSIHRCVQSNLPSQREQIRKKIYATKRVPKEVIDTALRTLDRLPDGETVCHGDFHLNNIILSPHGAVIIDWQNATKGNPYGDVAQTLLLLQLRRSTAGIFERRVIELGQALFRRLYLGCYLRELGETKDQILAWQIPVAVARLGEGIRSERAQLLTLVQSLIYR